MSLTLGASCCYKFALPLPCINPLPSHLHPPGALQAAVHELHSRRAKEGRLYASLFASGGLTSGIDTDGDAAPVGSGMSGADLSAGANDEVHQLLGKDDEVPGLSPELEAAFEGFGSLPLPGHPKPIKGGGR